MATNPISEDDLERRFWDLYGHLDLQPGEKLDRDDVAGSDEFSEEELDVLTSLGLVAQATA